MKGSGGIDMATAAANMDTDTNTDTDMAEHTSLIRISN